MSHDVAIRIPAEIIIANWESLRMYDPILIHFKTGEQRAGMIDEVFVKGNVLWIWPAGPEVRQLIQMAEIARISCMTADFSAARLAGLLQQMRPIEQFLCPGGSGRRSVE